MTVKYFVAVLTAIGIAGSPSFTQGLFAPFGKAGDTPVQLYTLTNAKGLVAKITNYGAIVTELHVPDRAGRLSDIVLGFDTLDAYLAGHPCAPARRRNRAGIDRLNRRLQQLDAFQEERTLLGE